MEALLGKDAASPEKLRTEAAKLDSDMATDTTSIRAFVVDGDKVRGSAFGQLMPGKGWTAGIAEEVMRELKGKDIFTGGAQPDNGMLGKEYYQNVTESPSIPTTSKLGTMVAAKEGKDKDPHTLATAVNDAGAGKFFVAGAMIDTDRISSPTMLANSDTSLDKGQTRQ